jgi:dolichol-phosphate mannosyltransferase
MRCKHSGELLKFCVVGGTGVIINLGLYYLLTRGVGLSLTVAAPMAIELSILSNFAFNNRWTFSRRKQGKRLAVKFSCFHCVSGLAGAVNFLSLFGLVHLLKTYDVFASLMGIGFGTLVNFYLSSLWTWKESSASVGKEGS